MMVSSIHRYLIIGGVLIGLWFIVASASSMHIATERNHHSEKTNVAPDDITAITKRVDQFFEKKWQQAKLKPANPADELLVLRRLSLSLQGTVPSLEEIRRFEADERPNRLSLWCSEMMEDDRFHWYFAERFARMYVGAEEGEFIVFRRDRFREWLAEQFRKNRPYNEMVQQLVSESGLWTGKPAANFVTGAVNEGTLNVNKLAGRTVRAFLGQRIDCAQCHDDRSGRPWSQSDFQQLAAYYNRTKISFAGVEDVESLDELKPGNSMMSGGMMNGGMGGMMSGGSSTPDDDVPDDDVPNDEIPDGEIQEDSDEEKPPKAPDKIDINLPPTVPFHPEWLGKDGTRRERLAAWVTHPENRRFHRAIVNRTWALMFGRPYSGGNVYKDNVVFVRCAVDDLPDPKGDPNAIDADLLDFLAQDFVDNGCNIRRLVLILANTRAFRLSSEIPDASLPKSPEKANIFLENCEGEWAVYPLTRLRPEQFIGAIYQASSIQTVDQNSHLIIRTLRFFKEENFIEEYGDLGADELEERAGTIPQTLLRMNGEMVKDSVNANPLSASARIASFSSSDQQCIENCFLTVLTRKPNEREMKHFLQVIAKKNKDDRRLAVEDIYWSMMNAPEFSWNH